MGNFARFREHPPSGRGPTLHRQDAGGRAGASGQDDSYGQLLPPVPFGKAQHLTPSTQESKKKEQKNPRSPLSNRERRHRLRFRTVGDE
ncbi:MAG: hypothetical protein KC588_12030 [Nitrospira sp.]|nr:hypothetical protein [Nitrospira sp.]